MRDTDELLREIAREPRPPSAPAPDRTGERIGPFEITGKLGQGGMGVVYAARDTQLGREVALKLLLPEMVGDELRRQRFLREARTGSAVLHPRLATVFQVGEHGDAVFIAMELIRGETLRARIDARGRLPAREAIDVALAIAEGVAATHRAGIVHRDLKPENVMLTEAGEVKVLDFGLAKSLELEPDDAPQQPQQPRAPSDAAAPQPPASALSRHGQILGTPDYMAPEQAAGHAVDARADVFALGVMLEEMLDGKPARPGSSDKPPALRALLARCRAPDPAHRFADCGALAAALVEARRSLTTRPRARRAALGLLTAIAVAAAAVALARPPRADACHADRDCPSGRCHDGACEMWSGTLVALDYGSLDAVVFTPAGDLVLGGRFVGRLDYGCGAIEGGQGAVLVTKFTATGACVWARAYDLGIALLGLVPTADGHFIASITGGEASGEDVNVRTTGALAELDADGRVVWSVPVTHEWFGWTPSLDPEGHPTVVGGAVVDGRTHLRATQLDRRGNVLWRRDIASDPGGYATTHGSTVDRQGDIVVRGAFTGGLRALGPHMVSAGARDAFVAKLSGADGAVRWAIRIGTAADEPHEGAVAVDAAGDVIVVGEQAGADLGGGPLPGTAYVAKLAGADGAHRWSRGFGGSIPRDAARRVVLDPITGDPIVFGRSLSPTIDFDAHRLVSTTGSGLFVVRLSSSDGAVQALRTFETTDATARAIALFPATHNVAVAGRFEGTLHLGPRRHTTATHDGFFMSLGPVVRD